METGIRLGHALCVANHFGACMKSVWVSLPREFRAGLLPVLLFILAGQAACAQSEAANSRTGEVGDHAAAVLGLLGYTVVPDLTTSFLSINRSQLALGYTDIYYLR